MPNLSTEKDTYTTVQVAIEFETAEETIECVNKLKEEYQGKIDTLQINAVIQQRPGRVV